MNASKADSAHWETTVSNRLPSLMRAIDDLILFLAVQQVDSSTVQNAQLAVEEMGTNIIKYGFDEPGEHVIVLEARCAPETVELTLIDDGHPFDPRTTPEPNPDAALEDRTPGGWGISLVRRLVSDLRYQRVNEQNILRLQFRRNRTAR